MGEAEEEKEAKREMKPWEQHAGVISIPRFNYNAPSSLLLRSHSGFFFTCSIKREKSATKEAMSILEKYVEPYNDWNPKIFQSSDVNVSAKRLKTSTSIENGDTSLEGKCHVVDADRVSKEGCSSCTKSDIVVERTSELSLVKLTKSGLVLLTFFSGKAVNTVDIVSKIFQSLEAGMLKKPIWCHRIFPIQATCCLNEKELHAVVLKLVQQFIDGDQNKLPRPIKFAIAYNRRGIEETCIQKTGVDDLKDSEAFSLFDRKKCFGVVASAIKLVAPDSAVDLKSPDLSVLVEVLPLSGLPNGSFVTAVSVVPQSLVTVKPRLCIKPLVSDADVKKGNG